MSSLQSRLIFAQNQIDESAKASRLSVRAPQLIAVSKRQSEAKLRQAIALGQSEFGENQVQEAKRHWGSIKDKTPNIRLHLIGPLQSNKVKEAVALFDVIHTIDREKIARAIKLECEKQRKNIPCLIQVNIGDEPQKTGIAPEALPDFLKLCRDDIGLPICGLMAVPPEGKNPAPYFALMKKLADRHHLPELSMGMSSDYKAAIRFGATYVRVGTALFGEREDP